jgi:hypothetical protein
MSILPWILAVLLPACDLCFSCESILGRGKGQINGQGCPFSSIFHSQPVYSQPWPYNHSPSSLFLVYILPPFHHHKQIPIPCFQPSSSIKDTHSNNTRKPSLHLTQRSINNPTSKYISHNVMVRPELAQLEFRLGFIRLGFVRLVFVRWRKLGSP